MYYRLKSTGYICVTLNMQTSPSPSPRPLVCPGAPIKGNDMPPPSPECILSPCARRKLFLDPSMRNEQTPPGSPTSPECPGAPLAPRYNGLSFGKALAALEKDEALAALEEEAEEREQLKNSLGCI